MFEYFKRKKRSRNISNFQNKFKNSIRAPVTKLFRNSRFLKRKTKHQRKTQCSLKLTKTIQEKITHFICTYTILEACSCRDQF